MKVQRNEYSIFKSVYNNELNKWVIRSLENHEIAESRYSKERYSDSIDYYKYLLTKNNNIYNNVSITVGESSLSKSINSIKNSWFKAADAVIADDNIEFLEQSKLEIFFEQTLDSYEIINDLGRKLIDEYYKKNSNIEHKVIAILHALSHIPYNKIDLLGPSIAGRCLCNRNIEISEFALKAFENWASRDDVQYLESVDLREEWLNEYLNKVIQYIKGM